MFSEFLLRNIKCLNRVINLKQVADINSKFLKELKLNLVKLYSNFISNISLSDFDDRNYKIISFYALILNEIVCSQKIEVNSDKILNNKELNFLIINWYV